MAYTSGYDSLEYPKEIGIRILAAQVNAAAGLGMWCFVKGTAPQSGDLVYSTCLKEKEFLRFLKLGKGLEFLAEHPEGWNRPVILSDSLGLIWAAEHLFDNAGKPEFLILMGPCFISSTSEKHIEEMLSRRFTDQEVRLQMARTLMDVPVLSTVMLDQYCKILHFTLTGQRIGASEFILQDRRISEMSKEDPSAVLGSDTDRVFSGEQRLLAAVREGNLQYQSIVDAERLYNGEFVCDTGDMLRDAKNSVIVFTVQCGRAAVEGGLSVSAMREIEKRYLVEIEKCTSVYMLRRWKDTMLDEYVTRVHQLQENALISKSIRDSCDYIRANVCSPLTVQEIADHAGYTMYYFTKKFSREMGVKVTDFIKQARIEYAKVALITTDQSIQDISDRLQFGNRNYFGKVFREITGVSPTYYRDFSGHGGAE